MDTCVNPEVAKKNYVFYHVKRKRFQVELSVNVPLFTCRLIPVVLWPTLCRIERLLVQMSLYKLDEQKKDSQGSPEKCPILN